MALITDLPAQASPSLSDYMIIDNGTTSSKTSISDVRAAMGFGAFVLHKGAIYASTTYTLENSSRHIIAVEGAVAARHGLYMVTTSSTGSVAVTKVVDGSSITISTGTNSITINPNGAAVYVVDFAISGSAIL